MRSETSETWRWLLEPLAPRTRQRLEITLGIVLAGAAVVGLSTVIRPDPSKLTPTTMIVPISSRAASQSEGHLRAELAPPPRVSPEFALAVGRGDLVAMEALHTPGMDLDGMLSVAAEVGERNVTLWLLDHGADVHEGEGSLDTPVLAADAHPDVVALLVERGASMPTLTTAAQAGALNAVVRLLAAHAPVDPPDSAPLHGAVASTRGSAENRSLIVEKLLAAGANPNRDDGETPLTNAVRACSPPFREGEDAEKSDCLGVVKLLVKRGARTKGDALVAALTVDESTQSPLLDTLLSARLEPGATAIALAQGWSPPPRVLKQLLAKGVDWAWRDGEDDAALPLLSAVQAGNRDYVRALLDAGAPVDVHFKDGTSTLGQAIAGPLNGGTGDDYARIVELLVARGADVNRRLPDGRTPLFAAAESGELRVVHALLAGGARVNDRVLDDTALDAAEQNQHQAAARVLHAHGARRARVTVPDTP